MKLDKVPQDNSSTYANNSKAVYATDDEGNYSVTSSTGWAVEEAVTKQALNEYQRLATEAHQQVREGLRSPLYYHMYAQRMDLMVLAQSMGWFQWRVKRHMVPSVFVRLSAKTLQQYSEALGVPVEALRQLPEQSIASSNGSV